MGATGLACYRSDQGHPEPRGLCGLLLAVTRATSGLLLRGCSSHLQGVLSYRPHDQSKKTPRSLELSSTTETWGNIAQSHNNSLEWPHTMRLLWAQLQGAPQHHTPRNWYPAPYNHEMQPSGVSKRLISSGLSKASRCQETPCR